MAKRFEYLSKPFEIGKVKIKNRFAVAPMDTGIYEDEFGGYSAEGIEYFVRRAKGGFGLIFSWGTNVDSKIDIAGPTMLQNPGRFIRNGQELNARISAYGAKMFVQLAFGLGRNVPGFHTPSPLPTFGQPELITEPLTEDQIRIKINETIEAAKIVKQAGFAGVEVHALHWGHLLDEFALSFMNHREDNYGGSLENRLRVAKEIVEGIKEACGKDFPVSIRLGVRSFLKDFGKACFTEDESEEKGRTVEESKEVAKLLQEYGYDCLSLDSGVLDSFYWCCCPSYIPQGYMVKYAEQIKEAVTIPVLVGSRMQDPEIANEGIKEGKFDVIVLGRPSLADPDLPNKIMTGHPEKVRPCIGCNSGCIQRYFSMGYVACAVNPEMGRSITYRLLPAVVKKKVVVVGGGVAGMEAARTSKLRGHEVVLLEKTAQLGGNLLPAGKHEFKKEILELNEWYKRELKELGIEMYLNTEATRETISKYNPDVIILAQGSFPVMPKAIKGIDHPKTMSCTDALLPGAKTEDKIVVVGGGLVGCEMALEYLKEGKKVVIVEALPDILSTGDVPFGNKQMLKDAFEHYGADVLCSTRLEEINDKGAKVILPNGIQEIIEADNVIIAVGFRPVASMAEDLQELGAEIYEVGDGNKVGSILTAIWQAYEVAHDL